MSGVGGKQRELRIIRAVEVVLGILGLVLTGLYAGAMLDRYANSRVALGEFQAEMAPTSAESQGAVLSKDAQAPQATAADSNQGYAGRIVAVENFLDVKATAAIAVLQIPKLHLAVPVFKDTKKLSLNRGVGWIEGTAAPTQEGNMGIAGHRDTFFRGLRHLERGDEILLVTREGTESFRVKRTEIVSPQKTSVLKPGAGRSLTLVTCYPFYYIGRAPKRFVVQAMLTNESHGKEIEKTGLQQTNGSRSEKFQGGKAP
jgi:sortase A